MDIYVSKPSLPDLEDLLPHIRDIWSSKQLTNFGPYYKSFQEAFARHFRTPLPIFTSSGNSALSVACCAAFSKGEIITTPYSFVSTSNVIVSSGCTPVFADISYDHFSITPESVENLVTKNTKGILATHCYGLPGDLEGLGSVAKKYSLPLIYDCAHGLGSIVKGNPLCSHGDISCLSFHATKLFNTFEGGAIIASDPDLQLRIKKLTNFGIVDEFDCEVVGTNAKMNELAAAIGLISLDYIDSWIQQRKRIHHLYCEKLSQLPHVSIPDVSIEEHNYSYMPILLSSNTLRESAVSRLKDNRIFARRYFYPIIPRLSAYSQYSSVAALTPVALDISERILCLPIYPDLSTETVELICQIIQVLP